MVKQIGTYKLETYIYSQYNHAVKYITEAIVDRDVINKLHKHTVCY